MKLSRQQFFDYTTFDGGYGAWLVGVYNATLKASISPEQGPNSPGCLLLNIEVPDAGGIIYLYETVNSDIEGDISMARVAWWYRLAARSNIIEPFAYLGAPLDPAKHPERLVALACLQGEAPLPPGWCGSMHSAVFRPSLPQLYAAVGWRVSGHWAGEIAVDEIVFAGR